MSARPHKQSMSELKLRRLTEHNTPLARGPCSPAHARIRSLGQVSPLSLAPASPPADPPPAAQLNSVLQNDKGPPRAHRLVARSLPPTLTLNDQVPSVWGPVGKGEDPYAPPQKCACVVM